MTKPRRIFLLAVAVVVIAAAGWHLYATREPSYQGKSLSQWLEEGDSGGCCQTNEMQEVDRAVRAIGKQALPNLLQMLRVKDSWLKVNLMKLGAKQSLIRIPFTSADEHQSRAVIGFRALGQEAREALPELTEILQTAL